MGSSKARAKVKTRRKVKARRSAQPALRGYASDDPGELRRLLIALGLDDHDARMRALDELARKRRERAVRFVDDVLERARGPRT
jgi:hypothetical protein